MAVSTKVNGREGFSTEKASTRAGTGYGRKAGGSMENV